jgi:signal transduction histidine kinase
VFAARVAHDLLSPLAAVSTALALNAREVTTDAARTRAERGISALNRVRQIVDGLLTFARAAGRVDAGARAVVNDVLRETLEELRPQAEERGVELRCEAVPPSEVACSDAILAVVVSNLVRNAIKFMDDTSRPLVTIRTSERLGRVRFEVEDSGPGLPPELHTSAFEPYFRGATSEPGLGLGLATVKRLVEAHHGRVGFEPAPARGSVFWFELPVARPTAAPGREALPTQA